MYDPSRIIKGLSFKTKQILKFIWKNKQARKAKKFPKWLPIKLQ